MPANSMPANSANNPTGFHTRYTPPFTELKPYLAMALGFVCFSSLITRVEGNEPPLPLSFIQNGTFFILSTLTNSNTNAIWNLYVFVANCLVTGELGPIIQLVDQYIPTQQIWSSNRTCNNQQLTLEANNTAQAVPVFLKMLNEIIGNSTEFETIRKECASLAHFNKIASIVVPIVLTVILVSLLVGTYIMRRREEMAAFAAEERLPEAGSAPSPASHARKPRREDYETLPEKSSQKDAKDDNYNSRELQVMTRALRAAKN